MTNNLQPGRLVICIKAEAGWLSGQKLLTAHQVYRIKKVWGPIHIELEGVEGLWNPVRFIMHGHDGFADSVLYSVRPDHDRAAMVTERLEAMVSTNYTGGVL